MLQILRLLKKKMYLYVNNISFQILPLLHESHGQRVDPVRADGRAVRRRRFPPQIHVQRPIRVQGMTLEE